MIFKASKWEQRVFTYWLERKVLQKRGITATAFLRMCDQGKVPGLEPGSDSTQDVKESPNED